MEGSRQGDLFVECSSCSKKTRQETASFVCGSILQCLIPEQRQYVQEIVLEAQDVTATTTNLEMVKQDR